LIDTTESSTVTALNKSAANAESIKLYPAVLVGMGARGGLISPGWINWKGSKAFATNWAKFLGMAWLPWTDHGHDQPLVISFCSTA